MSANTGGPAFPCEIPLGVQAKAHGVPAFVTGITVRDFFAAKFAAAQCTKTSADYIYMNTKYAPELPPDHPEYGETVAQRIARNAYELADAMIMERSK